MYPVILFVYNRPDLTEITIRSLAENLDAHKSDIYIYSDGPKDSSDLIKVESVRKIISNLHGFKSVKVVLQDQNIGLAQSVITGVSDILKHFTAAIVLEDDLLTSKYFLTYMNDALKKYEAQHLVMSVSGYSPVDLSHIGDTFFVSSTECWGWGVWARSWRKFNSDGIYLLNKIRQERRIREFNFNGAHDFEDQLIGQIAGINNSWSIRWMASVFLENGLTLYPKKSMVKNIGNDGSGTNTKKNSEYDVEIYAAPINLTYQEPVESKIARLEFEKFFRTKIRERHKIVRILKKILPIYFRAKIYKFKVTN